MHWKQRYCVSDYFTSEDNPHHLLLDSCAKALIQDTDQDVRDSAIMTEKSTEELMKDDTDMGVDFILQDGETQREVRRMDEDFIFEIT